MAATLEKLLPFRAKRPQARIRLICFPFAGGAASIFRPWGTLLPDDIDVCAVELPGRGTRYGEPLVDTPDALLQELSILRTLDDRPTVYFGHSLGGRIAYALIRQGLRADALIASASRAPQIPQSRMRSNLPKAALVDELRRLGGTPRAVLDDPDMLQLMLPIVRADFRILETLFFEAAEAIDCTITAIAAIRDVEVSRSDVESWRTLTSREFRLTELDAEHFFLSTHPETVLGEVRRVVEEVAAR